MSAMSLHLRPEEKVVFDGLSSDVQNGWVVENETLEIDDSPQKRRMRMHLLRLHDPKLLSFWEEAKTTDSAEALAALIEQTDLSDVNDDDLAELFFALGPETLSLIILSMMQSASSDTDLDDIAAMTEIRHSLLSSMQPSA